jgi:tRNA (guanine-N7-)-methyltransferase
MRNSTVSKLSRISKAFETYLLDPHELKPLFFNGTEGANLVLEIGFGNGELITRMAKSRERDFFVGVESSEISCEKAAKRAYDLGLQNVKFMRGDGKFLAREFFQDKSVDLALAFYPIPWPKESQKDKRLFEKEFLKTVSSILKPSGRFVIVTDDDSYFEWTINNFRELEIKYTSHALTPIKATKYGRKWEKLGRRSWSIISFHKDFEIKRILEGQQVPHAHIGMISEKELDEKLKALAQREFREGNLFVEFKGFFKGENEYVLRTVGVDGKFPQMYYIVAKRRNDGWLVRLDDVAKVFKTPAVKRSIEYVAEALKN